ncbi:MAG: hypothetical protein HFJ57_03600 [Clostridia bacterium]|nr:hypothetical protein [Clostridia bacterium]
MKITARTIIFGLIIVFCIFAINFGVYWQFFRNTNTNTIEPEAPITSDNTEQIEKNFKNIFENKLDYQGNNVNTIGITKKDSTKDLIYTWVSAERIVENKYDIKLNIPRINISNTSVEKFNEKVKGLYVDKANDIIVNATNNTVYTVEYMSYINTNIMSLVIKSTLKEGNNPQRVIIQTYNYNLSTNEEITFAQMLEIKGLQENTVKKTISEKIQKANTEAMKLKNLGYNVYVRDLSSDMYELKNITNFMLGEDNNLYIIYPYGNNNFTDEMDVIVFE